jgi:hypothetical protein
VDFTRVEPGFIRARYNHKITVQYKEESSLAMSENFRAIDRTEFFGSFPPVERIFVNYDEGKFISFIIPLGSKLSCFALKL